MLSLLVLDSKQSIINWSLEPLFFALLFSSTHFEIRHVSLYSEWHDTNVFNHIFSLYIHIKMDTSHTFSCCWLGSQGRGLSKTRLDFLLHFTVHWRASGPLWRAFGIPWLCYFAWVAEKLAKQTKLLPNSAKHKQPFLMQGGQWGVIEGQKRFRVRYLPSAVSLRWQLFFSRAYCLISLNLGLNFLA